MVLFVFMSSEVFLFLHKGVLMRGCSTSALMGTSQTLWLSWQVTMFPKTSVMTTATRTLRTPVPWERLVEALVLRRKHNI